MLAQTPETPVPPQPLPKAQFFAGTVTALTSHQITVSRTQVGHSPEHRIFLINPKTKLNRSTVRLKSRVTVKYRHQEQGDVALEIELQHATRTPRPS